jgi:DNA topoisomerase-3
LKTKSCCHGAENPSPVSSAKYFCPMCPGVESDEPGNCPKCGGSVYEHGMNYVCENLPARKCDFRSGKVILRQEIQREQMQKLLTTGRTDLLDAFVSNRNGRRFKAFLVRQPDGKVGFEFAPRAAKTGADDGAAKPAKGKKAAPATVAEKPAPVKKRAAKAKK